MLHNEIIAFAWETIEFEFKEKRRNWYWIIGVVSLILVVLAIILKNYLFALLLIIGTFLILFLATKKPLSLPVEVSQNGIKIYDEIYRYDSIFAFWISYNKKQQPILLLLSNRNISPIISITIDEKINLVLLREYFLEFIKEQELKEPLTNRIIDKIGF